MEFSLYTERAGQPSAAHSAGATTSKESQRTSIYASMLKGAVRTQGIPRLGVEYALRDDVRGQMSLL